MRKKKSPFTGQVSGATCNYRNVNNISTEAQRQRLLAYLKEKGSATTIFIRKELNILAPAPRVFELRKKGYPIETHWLEDITYEGHKHRVANYILPMKGGIDG